MRLTSLEKLFALTLECYYVCRKEGERTLLKEKETCKLKRMGREFHFRRYSWSIVEFFLLHYYKRKEELKKDCII